MKKNTLLISLLALLTFCNLLAEEVVTVPTVAVLNFDARNRQANMDDVGKSVSELMLISLIENGNGDFVERAELDKALNELQLSAVGLVDPNNQNKLGKIVGAKILITGSLFKMGEKNFLVAKIIGTETSRVVGASVNGEKDFIELVPELATKVNNVIATQSTKLLPKIETINDIAKELKGKVNGQGKKVYVSVKEDINIEVPDPAAETLLKKLLLELNFEVVGNRTDADYSIIGEAVASSAGAYGKFISSSARVELYLYNSNKKLLFTDYSKDTLAGGSYIIAAKDAINQATIKISKQLIENIK